MRDSHAIQINVTPDYMADHSSVMNDKYVFSYHIVIQNFGEGVVTLRKRYWEITDAHGDVEKVSGVGVVGEQPVLYPGDTFEYSSGAHLRTPWGSMQGYYEFEDDKGDYFSVPIPKFDLKAEFILH
ncbi:Co2+/Mg2+ efflux protein ApaG [Neisseria sp. S1]|uniref:Co2+/Mg2+ efflux protein ApaG n=1 Tax=Neisseria sp. S1 TaxID=3318354 RepID=UPI003A8951C6